MPITLYRGPHCHMGRSVGVLVCEAYRDRWEGKNLELVVADTAPFLLKVVLRIKKLEEQEQDLGAGPRSSRKGL
jgi:hypothetical protein